MTRLWRRTATTIRFKLAQRLPETDGAKVLPTSDQVGFYLASTHQMAPQSTHLIKRACYSFIDLTTTRLCNVRRLSVCLSVSQQLYIKTTEPICIQILPEINLWTRKNQLDLGTNLLLDRENAKKTKNFNSRIPALQQSSSFRLHFTIS